MNKRELRKIDREVSEKIFLKGKLPYAAIYNYSTEIEWAWKVINKLVSAGLIVDIRFQDPKLLQAIYDKSRAFSLRHPQRTHKVWVTIKNVEWALAQGKRICIETSEKTAPLAICQAALKLWEERKLSLSPPHEPHEASCKNTK